MDRSLSTRCAVLLLLALAPASAMAKEYSSDTPVRISLMGGIDYSTPTVSGGLVGGAPGQTAGDTFTPGIGKLGAFAVEYQPGRIFGVEMDAMIGERVYSVGNAQVNPGGSDTFTERFVEIPLLFRLHLGKYFSIGAGGYAAYFLGNASDAYQYGPGGGGVTNIAYGYSDRSLSRLDYGAAGSVAFYAPFSIHTSLVFDFRYTQGINNLDANTGLSRTYKDMQALTGLQFLF